MACLLAAQNMPASSRAVSGSMILWRTHCNDLSMAPDERSRGHQGKARILPSAVPLQDVRQVGRGFVASIGRVASAVALSPEIDEPRSRRVQLHELSWLRYDTSFERRLGARDAFLTNSAGFRGKPAGSLTSSSFPSKYRRSHPANPAFAISRRGLPFECNIWMAISQSGRSFPR
jgi:hypothetical protein